MPFANAIEGALCVDAISLPCIFLPETSWCCTQTPHFLQSSVPPVYLKLTSVAHQRTKTAVWFVFLINLCMYAFIFMCPNAGLLSTLDPRWFSFELLDFCHICSHFLRKYFLHITWQTILKIWHNMVGWFSSGLHTCICLLLYCKWIWFTSVCIFWWCNKRLHLGDGEHLSFESMRHINLGKRLDIRTGWLDMGTMQSLSFGVVVAGRGSWAEIDNESRT